MGLIQTDLDGLARTNIYFDEHTGECHVEQYQDVEPLIDRIQAMKNAGHDGYNQDRSFRAIAEVPVVVFEQMQREGVDVYNPAHNDEVLKRLRDPALAKFRLDQNFGPVGNIIVKGER